MISISENDLQEIYKLSNDWFVQLQGKTIFLTGGTGFFGKWIISSIIHANKHLKNRINVISITRNLASFKKNHPEFSDHPDVNFIESSLSEIGKVSIKADIFIHCAANVITSKSSLNKEGYIEDELLNTNAILNYCKENGVKRLIYTSSGAVYGSVDNNHPDIEENSSCNSELTPYGEAKKLSEAIIKEYCLKHNIEFNIARCFAFLGGYIPLNGSFAAGNFLKNVINDENIIINSDGQALRSFMYMTDLCASIFNISVNKEFNKVINIGSSESVSIKDLADEISKYSNSSIVIIKEKQRNTIFNKYVPNVNLAQKLFGIRCRVDFNEAVKRTLLFYQRNSH